MAEPNILLDVSTNHKGKYSDKWSLYLDFYWQLFEPLQGSSFDLLEIGVQNGGSLEIWGKFFKNVTNIIGFDNDPKCAKLKFDDSRIKVFIGDASTKETRDIIKRETSDLGVVIDDGSHTSSDIIRTFLLLFPLVKPGGIYVIEDLHASYWESWQGGLSSPSSSMQFLKLLADVVNFDHWGIDAKRGDIFSSMSTTSHLIEESLLSEISSVTFTDSLCVVRKKASSDSGLGVRVGFGKQADVEPRAADSNGTFLISPSQEQNPFADPKDLSLTRISDLKNQNGDLENQNRDLENQNRDLENQNRDLENQLTAIRQTLSCRMA